MKINPWIEHPNFREVQPYSEEYAVIFSKLRNYILENITGIEVEHFGSTAVPGLAAKPMIDILVIAAERNLLEIKKELMKLKFHERDVWVDTPEKPYVGGSIIYNKKFYDVNVHVCRSNSPEHITNITFRDALRKNADLRSQYEKLKNEAITMVGKTPEEYNKYKSEFIRNVVISFFGK